MAPDLPVTKLKGVGEKLAETLWKLQIRTLRELVGHFPRRYEDRTRFVKIGDVRDGEYVTILGKITAVENKPLRNKLVLTKVTLDDGSWVLVGGQWVRTDNMARNDDFRRGPNGDRDGDGILNRFDNDRDGDGVMDQYDNFPNNPNRS